MCVGWDCGGGRTGVEGWERRAVRSRAAAMISQFKQARMQSAHSYIAPGARWTWPIHPTRQATH